jgi:hypothetical protein
MREGRETENESVGGGRETIKETPRCKCMRTLVFFRV